MVKALFFSKHKCLSEDLFILPTRIMCTVLVTACKVLKKLYYKNMIITLKTANMMIMRQSIIKRLVRYLSTPFPVFLNF